MEFWIYNTPYLPTFKTLTMATLRGSKDSLLLSIAETLKLALKDADNEKQLRENIETVIKIVEKQAKAKGKWDAQAVTPFLIARVSSKNKTNG